MSAVSPILLVDMAASCICCSVMKCAKVGGWSFQRNFQVMGIVITVGDFGLTLNN